MIDRVLSSVPPYWRGPIAAAMAAFVGILLLFHQTSWSIVNIWLNADTYNHGFLILPIALWLVWEKRRVLAPLMPGPTWLPLPMFGASGLLWGLASLVGVQVVAQLALVAMLITALWSLLGHQVSRSIAFPLLFLFLAVPMGQGLVPPMMEFTATFTVTLLELSGVPVYREGLFFTLPSGNWSVVEACSGVRYIIASVTLGMLYAYLSYRGLWRRLVFVLLSFLVPILANGVRAYLIVMIGHLSDMKLAVGVDHLIYGWIFFGLVMLLLFWIGSWWAEPESAQVAVNPGQQTGQPGAGWTPVGAALLVMAMGIQGGTTSLASRAGDLEGGFVLPAGEAGWVAVQAEPWSWKPAIHGAPERRQTVYRKDGDSVSLFVALYPSQSQGNEAVSSFNAVVDTERRDWRVLREGTAVVEVGGVNTRFNSFDVAKRPNLLLEGDGARELLIWQWYQMGEHKTASPYMAKIYETMNRIYPGRADGAYIVIAVEKGWQQADREVLLQSFVRDMLPAIERSMSVALGHD